MRAVIQAVSSASVRVNGGEPRPIGPGLVILLGVKDTDTLDIVPKLAEKCAGLRIFKDENDKLNLSAKDLGYSALVVSQFTLYGDTRKGFRPSFIKAAKPPLAVDAYELFLAEMNQQGLKEVQHGEFGAGPHRLHRRDHRGHPRPGGQGSQPRLAQDRAHQRGQEQDPQLVQEDAPGGEHPGGP